MFRTAGKFLKIWGYPSSDPQSRLLLKNPPPPWLPIALFFYWPHQNETQFKNVKTKILPKILFEIAFRTQKIILTKALFCQKIDNTSLLEIQSFWRDPDFLHKRWVLKVEEVNLILSIWDESHIHMSLISIWDSFHLQVRLIT